MRGPDTMGIKVDRHRKVVTGKLDTDNITVSDCL